MVEQPLLQLLLLIWGQGFESGNQQQAIGRGELRPKADTGIPVGGHYITESLLIVPFGGR